MLDKAEDAFQKLGNEKGIVRIQELRELLKQRGASVSRFTLYVVGEGLEKRKDDFAAEVAAQAAAAKAAAGR